MTTRAEESDIIRKIRKIAAEADLVTRLPQLRQTASVATKMSVDYGSSKAQRVAWQTLLTIVKMRIVELSDGKGFESEVV